MTDSRRQTRYSNKKKFLVMPGRGISGKAMQASVFQDRLASSLTTLLNDKLLAFEAGTAGSSMLQGRTARAEITDAIDAPDFVVISQRFEDGPVTVEMTDAARLALEAGNPDLRIVPITRYYLPGFRPSRSQKGMRPAGHVAAESATAADGTVFSDDVKQHFVSGLPQGGAMGNGVLVGVIDTGVDGMHPALAGKVVASRCYIPGEGPTEGRPVNWGAQMLGRSGHGTHVAGIIAASAGHGGPPGVAPHAKVVSYRIFPDSIRGVTAAENAVIIDSIRAAIEDGCHVVNLSIEGATLREDGVRSAVADAWENGVICIAAAGNGMGNPVSFPAALQHCVAVTAIGREGAFPNRAPFTTDVSNQRAVSDQSIFLAKFSNFGPQVQFTAPGHAIVSTYPGGEWWFSSGTSMAAPYVSGMLARLLSDNSNVLGMAGDAQRSAAMLQMLIARSHALQLPQVAQEGYGLPG